MSRLFQPYVTCTQYIRVITRPFSFIFTLQEFCQELVSLVDAMERIYLCEQLRLHRRSWIFQAITSVVKIPHQWYLEWRNGSEKSAHRPSRLKRRICESFHSEMSYHAKNASISCLSHTRASCSSSEFSQNKTPCTKHGSDTISK